MVKKKIKFGSILTGIGLGILLGIWMNFIYTLPFKFIFPLVGAVIFGIFGLVKPKLAETGAYAISIYVFLQIFWDYAVLDRGEIRMTLLFGAIILLLINGFSGYYGWYKPKKIFGKATGIK